MSRIAEVIAHDPNVRSMMAVVFGKTDVATIDQVMRSPNDEVVSKALDSGPVRPFFPDLRPAVATVSKSAPIRMRTEPPADDGLEDITVTTNIEKADDEQRTVFGWASITEIGGRPVVDRQGDMMDIEELSKSAYDYVVSSRKGGHQHKRTEVGEPLHVSDMIESVVFTPEKIEKMGLSPDTPIGWWVGYKVRDDEIWDAVKRGEITGFSVHGKGRRVPVD